MHYRRCTALALGLLVTTAASADKLTEPSSGVSFDAAPTYNGIAFSCLGVGLRKKFVVKVYAVTFCVEQAKAHDAVAAALAAAGGKASEDSQPFFTSLKDSPTAKAADMVFVRDVDKGKIAEAFEETLKNALGDDDKDGQAQFLALVNRDIAKGDHILLTTQPDGTIHLAIAGHDGKVTDAKVARHIWNAWLGPNGVAPSLKESIAAAAH